MVKIKFRPILIGFVVFMFLLSGAYATRQALEFSDVDVKVGSKTDKGLNNGELISEEAEPGDAVEFRVEVRNNYTSAENLDIENVQVTVRIEDIDDGEEMEEQSTDFDIRPGSDRRVTLKFQIPLEVDEDDFDVIIEAEGEDENNTDQNIEMRLRLEVDKQTHLLKITRSILSPNEVACGRKNIQAAVTVINLGTEDEEDVNVQIVSSDLGVDIKENVGELEAEPNEETSRFSRTYSFNVPNDAEEGSYPVTFRALYDDDRKKAEVTSALTVNSCGTETAQESTEDVVVVTPGNGQSQGTSTILPEDTVITSESFFSSNGFVIAVIIAEVIAVIVGIVLIVSLFARRE